MTSRRAVLAAAAGPILLRAVGGVTVGSALAACGRSTPGVEVFVMWSGGELAAFRETMAVFSREYDLPVRVVPVGEQVNELLQARLDTDNPPDLAIVPLLGLIRDYAKLGHVYPLPRGLGDTTQPKGLRLAATMDDGRIVGLWVKAAHKSLFWHRGTGEFGTPTTWDDLVRLVRDRAGAGHTPLAIGAADGWVVTDWFENVLLGVGGGATYDKLAQGEHAWGARYVTDALTRLAELWSVADASPGGAERALLTQYEESVVQVFATHRADLVFEADFVSSVIDSFAGASTPRLTFPFPPVVNPAGPPLVVGGDVAALLTDRPEARQLIEWLDRPDSMDPWIDRGGGFLSPNLKVEPRRYRTALATQLAGELQQKQNELRFDLSDQVTGRLGGGQGRGMGRILQDFFGAVATGRSPDAAVRRAQDQLIEASQGTP